MEEQQERALINQLKAGHIKALTPLVLAHQQRALRTAYLITQDATAAEDVVQAAFLRVYQAIHQFDASRRFAPWFLRIVANLAVQTAQRQARQLSLDAPAAPNSADSETTFAEWLTDAFPNPETELEQQELADKLHALLQRLTPQQRSVIVLRYYVDLTEREMAYTLAVPVGTIKSRLSTARKHLRAMLRLNPL